MRQRPADRRLLDSRARMRRSHWRDDGQSIIRRVDARREVTRVPSAYSENVLASNATIPSPTVAAIAPRA
jgi:hypothetical protein